MKCKWILRLGALLLSACAGYAACFFAGAGQTGARLKELEEIAGLVCQRGYYGAAEQALYDGAAKGMLRALDDDYAAYYTRQEYKAIEKRYSGAYTGLGLALVSRDGLMYISDVYDDTPAERAGLHPGDILVQLDGKNTAGMQPEEVAARIPGTPGAPVQLVVNSGGANSLVELEVAELLRHRVRFRMIDDAAYIAIEEFTGDCVEGFKAAVSRAKECGARSMVLDLRQNPGGNLMQVLEIADMLIDKGTLLTVCERDGGAETFESEKGCVGLPLAVLINEGSASASEVLAGAVRDHKAGALIGQRTFGKGIVQTTYSLEGGGMVKLTTAAYYTPCGENIHKKGIQPDIECALPESLKNVPVRRLKLDSDAQLKTALEYLSGR